MICVDLWTVQYNTGPDKSVIHFSRLSDHRLVTLVVSAKNSLWRSWFLPTTLFHFDDTIIVFSLWFQCLVLYFIFIGWVPPLYLCIQVCSSVCVLYISHILSSIMHCNLFEIYIGTWYQLLVEFDYWFDIVFRYFFGITIPSLPWFPVTNVVKKKCNLK